jgi:site-specific DNA recombinase
MGAEGRALDRDLARWHGEVHQLSCQLRPGEDNGPPVARLAGLQERIATVEGRVHKVREQIQGAYESLLDEDQAATALSLFDPVWEALTLTEQARVVDLLVERVDYDGARGKLSITFHPTGIKALADELAGYQKGQTA